jgi:hypothetical protein
MSWYKWIWSHIGGRPWTYIIRDAWHKIEFIWIIGLVSLGIWLGHTFDWTTVLIGWLIFSAGYIAGHLFWGTPYVPGQGGE